MHAQAIFTGRMTRFRFLFLAPIAMSARMAWGQIAADTVAQSRASVLYLHPAGLAASTTAVETTAASSTDIPHGLIGGVSGAIVGGALGYLWMDMQCDNDVCGPATRPVLTGAAVGAVIGIIVEYGIRSWPEKKTSLDKRN
jgi:hypothetical protein